MVCITEAKASRRASSTRSVPLHAVQNSSSQVMAALIPVFMISHSSLRVSVTHLIAFWIFSRTSSRDPNMDQKSPSADSPPSSHTIKSSMTAAKPMSAATIQVIGFKAMAAAIFKSLGMSAVPISEATIVMKRTMSSLWASTQSLTLVSISARNLTAGEVCRIILAERSAMVIWNLVSASRLFL